MRWTCCLAIVLVSLPVAGCGRQGDRTVGVDTPATTSTEETYAADNQKTKEGSASEAASPTANSAAARQYQELLAEFEIEGGARLFAKRFLALAEQHPQDPAAADALLWIVRNVRGKPITTRALELLASHHSQSQKLGLAGKDMAAARSIAAEKLLRTLLEESPHEHVRAQACYYLASQLDHESNLVEQLKAQPELAPRVLQYYGDEYGAHLASLDFATLEREREQVYERMRAAFAEVEVNELPLGELAEQKLFRIRHLSVGKVAPEIDGEDIDGNRFKLSDYRGKVVLLTFWGHW